MKQIKFKDVKVAQRFKRDGRIFLKIEEESDDYDSFGTAQDFELNAIYLENGEKVGFGDDIVVEVIE